MTITIIRALIALQALFSVTFQELPRLCFRWRIGRQVCSKVYFMQHISTGCQECLLKKRFSVQLSLENTELNQGKQFSSLRGSNSLKCIVSLHKSRGRYSIQCFSKLLGHGIPCSEEHLCGLWGLEDTWKHWSKELWLWITSWLCAFRSSHCDPRPQCSYLWNGSNGTHLTGPVSVGMKTKRGNWCNNAPSIIPG